MADSDEIVTAKLLVDLEEHRGILKKKLSRYNEIVVLVNKTALATTLAKRTHHISYDERVVYEYKLCSAKRAVHEAEKHLLNVLSEHKIAVNRDVIDSDAYYATTAIAADARNQEVSASKSLTDTRIKIAELMANIKSLTDYTNAL